MINTALFAVVGSLGVFRTHSAAWLSQSFFGSYVKNRMLGMDGKKREKKKGKRSENAMNFKGLSGS